MSGRSKGRSIKTSRRKNEENKFDKPESLTLLDLQCTLCIGIFIEPVTLPCFHTVCKVCLEKTIDNNTLACPLCRKYVGGWVRQRQKNGLMVNQTLWTHINQHFEIHVQKKLKGEDDEEIDGLAELNIRTPTISEPGLIRSEYEAERKRQEEEARKQQEMEALASEKLIKELQEREEKERKHLEELRKKAEEEDALIAQRIAAQLEEEERQKQASEEESLRRLLEEEQVSSAFVSLPSSSQTSQPVSQPLKKGPMDMFLSQFNLRKLARTGSSSSTDSLNSELHYFRPVHHVPTTPPKSSPDGSEGETSQVCKPVPVMRSLDGWTSAGSNTLRPWIQTNPGSCPSSSSVAEGTEPSASPCSGEKRDRSPSDVLGRSPKRSKLLLALDKPSICKPLSDKRAAEKSKSKAFDSPQETAKNFFSKHSSGLASSSIGSPFPKNVSQGNPKNGLFDIQKALLPLSLQDFVDPEFERRCEQEQKDYEFALKLQNELNTSQNRSYELRSIVSLSPKKKQTKVTTPRGKVKAKPPTSSTKKKERRRQCTLEESINFSVKMEL